MTFYAMMSQHFEAIQLAELVLRIVVATLCGAIIGIERSHRLKEAGLRTHCMVACAAALIMIISKYGFADLTDASGTMFAGVRGADPARVVAQVVSGISFLGVGIIYRGNNSATRGLTTAAGIWIVAGIGMAIGAGLYIIGIFTTFFLLAVQIVTHRFATGTDLYNRAELEIELDSTGRSERLVRETLAKWDAIVVGSKLSKEANNKVKYTVTVLYKSEISLDEIESLFKDHNAIKKIRLAQEN